MFEQLQQWLLPTICKAAPFQNKCEDLLVSLAASAIWATLAYVCLLMASKLYNALVVKKRIFISIPMAGLDDRNDFDAMKKLATDLSLEITRNSRSTVYCAYDVVSGPENFPMTAVPALEVLTKIRKCDYFLAILPKRVYTSTLIEIGYAMGKKKNVCIAYFEDASGNDTLPYLLKTAAPEARIGLKFVKYKFSSHETLVREVRRDPIGFMKPSDSKRVRLDPVS